MKISIIGANGKIGRELISLIETSNDLSISSLHTSNINNLDEIYKKFSKNISEINSDMIIDFSNAEATNELVNKLSDKKIPLIIGTTGLTTETMNLIYKISNNVPVMVSSNFSLGINIVKKLACFISNVFDYDIEIIEKHHKYKIDSPSGTAFSIANEIKNIRKNANIVTENRFKSKRVNNEIGISSVRGGNIFGEHEILFIGQDEQISLSHQVFNRKIFAKYALESAKWLIHQQAGLYDFKDYVENHLKMIDRSFVSS